LLGSALFLLVAPGVVAGLVPWLLTSWQAAPGPAVARVIGWILIAAGGAALLSAFAGFALDGRGTPAPVAPTERLVVTGLYRFVRNPMYLAVAALIVGQALVLARPVLWVYAAVFLVTVVAFVRLYEEPTLTATYGDEYDAYRRGVRGWWPRLRPWTATEPRG
jgi:protein-S-isoprenylcysteine O-methyltransferase Ste14